MLALLCLIAVVAAAAWSFDLAAAGCTSSSVPIDAFGFPACADVTDPPAAGALPQLAKAGTGRR